MATCTPSQIYHRLVRIDVATIPAALRSLSNSMYVPKIIQILTAFFPVDLITITIIKCLQREHFFFGL